MSQEPVIANHRLREARFVASPNHCERPDGSPIDLLIIHNISLPPGEFGTGCIEQLFCNRLDPDAHPFFAQLRELRVASHLLIDRRGTVTQFVPFDRAAWHAGESRFDDRERCNDFSIGIELEGTDHQPFTAAQYDSLITVTRALLQAYPEISPARITGHSDVAPGRKTDPGPHFDWSRYLGALDAAVATREGEPP